MLAKFRLGLRARGLRLGLFCAAFFACVALIGTDVWHSLDLRAATIRSDKAETANLVRSLAQHAHDTVQSVDTAIVALREVAETEGITVRTAARLRRLMQIQASALPVLHRIFIVDAAGQEVADSLDIHASSPIGSERAYFRHHLADTSRDVHLGDPVHSEADGAWVLTVSRRLDAADGSFAGVVVATVSVDAIQDFYASFDVGQEGAIALISDSGILLARKPADDLIVGSSISKGQFFSKVRQGDPTGSFMYVSSVDGVTRLGSFRRVDGFHLVVLASHGVHEVLAGWWRDAILHFVVSCAIALVLCALGLILSRQVKRRQSVESSLRVNERHYRMLAENSTDLVVQLDPGMRRVYVSPTCRALLGYEPRDLVGRLPKDIVHPEDWPELAATLAAAGPEGSTIPLSYRVRKHDGSELWVEAAGRRLRGEEGYILTLRDITERRKVEELLHESNKAMQRLVMVDALTSVGNQQSFDVALPREHARVQRSDMPLSLLLINVDHFGLFNDRFGRHAGDRCLTLIAEAIESHIMRSSDTVARLDGDLFSALLPETDAQGALAVAQAICESARELDPTGTRSPDAGRPSVSIGIATAWPKRDPAGPQDLIQAAGEGLSLAKASGRNRSCVAAALPPPRRGASSSDPMQFVPMSFGSTRTATAAADDLAFQED